MRSVRDGMGIVNEAARAGVQHMVGRRTEYHCENFIFGSDYSCRGRNDGACGDNDIDFATF